MKGFRKYLRTALTSGCLMATVSIPYPGHAQDAADAPFAKRQLVDLNEQRRKDPFMILHDKPLSESPTLIPELMAKANNSPPAYLFELARRLWPDDKPAALEWYAVGMARARYDAMRCVDPTARQGIDFLPMIAPEVMEGIKANRKEFGEAGQRALARQDLFVDTPSPQWICTQGMAAINAAIQGKPLSEQNYFRPIAEWAAIRSEIRREFSKFFTAQSQPQDDPAPMATTQFPRVTLPPEFIAPYAWLDNEHLVAVRNEKDSEGKFIRRIVSFSADGAPTDVAKTKGIWCAGNGVVAYQAGQEDLPDKSQRITLAIGTPGKFASQTLELRQPFLNVFGPQSLTRVSMLPANSARQSPFDCHWETNELLSGPKNATEWFPLRPGDGAIRLQDRKAQWVSAKGEVTTLPVDTRGVSLDSFRYLAWKDAYFVAPTWSRLSYRDEMPSCMPAAFIYPKQGRIEATCAPFDVNNTSNAVMFSPSRLGWLRAAAYRNTAHGLMSAGLYLVRPDGTTEKLLNTNVHSWSLSPDGCRVAMNHSAPKSSSSVIEVLDLCP